jgi:WD40 repeat protein/energy-coupling factor transporter ATP-binding protein EcfA2
LCLSKLSRIYETRVYLMARYALVIGISAYLSPSLSPLSKTINDAEAVAKLLEQYGEFQSVQRLPQRWNKEKNGYEIGSAKVSGSQIGQALREFLLEKAKQSEAFIYFSGHGFTISDNLGQQKGFLATSDCQIEVAGNQIVEQKYAIPLDSLNELIRDSQLSSLVMLLDCCHSGYFLERQLIERTLTSFTSPRDYYLIAACRGFERAGVIKSQEYSIFTGAVVKGLAPENAGSSRRISSDRLFDFVSNELKGSVQEPIRMGWGRAISLVTYPADEIPIQKEITFNRDNPYRGLYAFEAEQADYFKGRDQAVRLLMSRLADSRFLAVIGYSGSGKSSLVKAGLLPQLKSDRIPSSSQWEIISFTPGEHPLGKLTDALTRQKEDKPQLLFIDQFEEIFTLCQNEEERKSFIRLIVQEVNTTERQTRIIITIRGDFLNRCADYLEIANLINSVPPTSFIVTPMSPTELEAAIEQPANLHGVAFELGLVSQIATDVINRPGALPILQYALKELWRVCIEEPESPEPILTHRGYAEIDGVKGALDKRATIIYQSLSEVDQEFARRLFMELVQLSDTGEVTRRRADWERIAAIADSPQQLQRVVELLAGSQQRLIITDENTIEVAHEALLTEWKLLNSWIEENKENIRLSRSVEEDCREWDERFNQSDEALLAGAKLAVISEWVNKNQPRLTPLEAEFFQQSLEKRDREIQAQIVQAQRLQREAEAKAKAESQRTRLAIASATLVVLSVGLGLLLQQRTQEKRQGDAIASGALVGKAELLLDNGNQLEAMIASVQALKELQGLGGDNSQALNPLKVVIDSIKERNRLEGHTKSVNGISYSPTEPLIVSASSDYTLRLWKLDGTPVQTSEPMQHEDEVYTVNFSPNGEYIASASADKTIKLWKKDGTYITTLKGHKQAVSSANFSPDSQTVISAGSDGTIRLWNIESVYPRKIIQPTTIQGNNDTVWYAEFSPNGQMIASAANNGIEIWNKDGTLITNLRGQGHTAAVRYVTFGRDNKTIISASEDRTIRIWNMQTDSKKWQTKLFTTQADKSFMVKFSPDYQFIASANPDGTINIFQANNGEKIAILKRHQDEIFDLSFRPNSKEMATVSADKTIKIWSLVLSKQANSKNENSSLLRKSCDWLKDYLSNNINANQKYKDVNNICQNLQNLR